MNPAHFRVVVASTNRARYSETFIHHAYDALPCHKTLLYGGYLPTHWTLDWQEEGEEIPVARPGFLSRKPIHPQAQQALNLRKWLERQRPGAILAHYGPSGVALGPVCKGLGIPLVVHFHGYDAYRADVLGSYGPHYGEMFQQARALVVVSEDMLAQVLRLGAPREKVHLCRYGVDVDRFAPQPLPATPFTFLFVGRFVPKKAPALALQAFAGVVRQVPGACLRMVGDGERMGECKALAVELGIGESVTFLGILPPEEVAREMAGSHALVLPSHRTADGDSEGTPLVVMEAAAAGRAVVGTLHGGIPEVVAHGQSGLLVPEGDLPALAGVLLHLATHRDVAARMGDAGRALAVAKFRSQEYHGKLWELLKSLT